MKLKRILIMTGGTGGHVFPGLALALYARSQGIDVHWMGTKKGIEARLVPQAQFPLHFISITGLRGNGIKTILSAPFRLSAALWQARKIIRRVDPDVIVGLGGFVSGPGGIAGALLKVPLIIHEQNARAGFTNKMLGYAARKVLTGFPDTFKNQNKVICIGNPVRKELIDLPPPEIRMKSKARLKILVLGGSLGAQRLNEIVPDAIMQIEEHHQPVIWHQTGEKQLNIVQSTYQTHHINAKVMPFIENMAEAYAWADLVICRAGALTVAELCSVGLGAIFIPYPYAVDDHQTANANYMVKQQAALCFQQAELNPTLLAKHLMSFIKKPQACLQMAEAAYQLRKTNVTERFFDIIVRTVSS